MRGELHIPASVGIISKAYLNKKKEVRIRFKDFAVQYGKWAEANNRSYKKSKEWIIKRLVGYFGEKLLSDSTSWHVVNY